ncbi:MAG: hypothetical protein JXR26_00595 [Balneolaceae bacterium]|nr:hypothetical protein [Balneolaceae bacterium]
MKKILQIANVLALIATITINYTASAGLVSGVTIGQISDQYSTLVTPADYAFSIWGVIYLMLTAFVVYQARGLFKKIEDNDFIMQVRWWFVVSCVANSLWVVTWVFDYTGISVLMMAILFFSLLKIVVNTNMERWDAPFPKILLLWWPFCLYSGWITVAIIPNIAAYLTKIGWNGFGLSDPTWAIIMITAAGIINLYMIWTRNMREFALVGIWALISVAIRHWGLYPGIAWTAIITSIILYINISVHGYQNRDTSPYIKWKQMRNATK